MLSQYPMTDLNIKIGSYHVKNKLADNHDFFIYKGFNNNNEPVSIKVYKRNIVSLSDIARIKQEYRKIKHLDIDGLVKHLDVFEFEKNIAVVYEEYRGVQLNQFMTNKKLNMSNFIILAIKLTGTISQIHDHNIIHRNINPHNIIIIDNRDKKKEALIADFGIQAIIEKEIMELYNPDFINNKLPYLSPEQTGRMNRLVDYRTDLYSLGIVFYELLTGKLPFLSDDPLELIHFHIAKEPDNPLAINKDIPEALANIILKLLAKDPELRYQSSAGLQFDLKKCLDALIEIGKISSFATGEKDLSERFTIPQTLIGREKELAELLSVFDRVSQGNKEIMLVSGEAGIGKSLLVNEIHKPILEKKGYFIFGKYEYLRVDIPYSGIIQAFQTLIKQILREGEERIVIWQKKLLDVLGTNGSIIIDVIPELQYIIGKQAKAAQLAPEETQHRFNFVFKNFVSAFTKYNHPVTLFLDDVQWIDRTSLNLIKTLAAAENIKHLFMIFAYRQHDVNELHPFQLCINEINQLNIPINNIRVNPLMNHEVEKFVNKILKSGWKQTNELSKLVYHKTNGNPFFIKHFIQSLYEHKLIHYDISGWKWDIDKLKHTQLTDNVVELMTHKIAVLPANTQEVLKKASCIGNRFDPETLAIILDKPMEEIVAQLVRAYEEGLINFSSNVYVFQHDRIQEAAYSLIPDKTKIEIHSEIGLLILKKSSENEIQNKIFDIVNHLNRTIAVLKDQNKRYELAALNLQAGEKAKKSAAYISALNYFKIGIDLMGEDNWRQHYDLCLNLHIGAAEAAYLTTDFMEMELLAETVLAHSTPLLDKIKIYEIKIRTFMAQNKLLDAFKIGRIALKLLGIHLPQKPNKLHLLSGFIRTKILLTGKKIDTLCDLPVMQDPKKKAIARIMAALGSVLYRGFPEQLLLLVFKLMKMTIKYGNSEDSSYLYAGYGMLLCSIGDINTGHQFGKLALKLQNKIKAKNYETKTYFVVNGFIKPWKEHLSTTFSSLLKGYETGMEIGDLEFAAHSAMVFVGYFGLSGKNLQIVEKEIGNFINVLTMLKQKPQLLSIKIFYQYVLNLMHKTDKPYELTGSSYNETDMPAYHLDAHDRTAFFLLYASKLMLAYHFGQYPLALENSLKAQAELQSVLATYYEILYNFHDSLVRLALVNKTKNLDYYQTMRKVKRNQKKMKVWADHAPMNNIHKYYLVKAEIARVKGQDEKAILLYSKSIKQAHKSNYIQDEALAFERAALFYLDRTFMELAGMYMTRAHYYYLQWGALAKSTYLEQKYPYLISTKENLQLIGSNSDSDGIARVKTAQYFDFSTVIKALQALSKEIDIGKLLATIMKIAIENAGAQKGFLIFEHNEDGNLYIETESMLEQETRVLQSAPLEKSQNLCIGIVNYVHKTKNSIVLHKAFAEGDFKYDPYIIKNQTKSILCTPIIHQGKILVILYLENNLTTSTFTPDRLEILKILSTQAAISIENSRFYTELEKRVQSRTKELNETQQRLIETAHRAGMSEIATDVLHNVGNILNSVNISTDIIRNMLSNSKVKGLLKANDLIINHKQNIVDFIKSDPKGKLLPEYYIALGGDLMKEHRTLDQESKHLVDKITILKEVIKRQQDYVKVGLFKENFNIVSVIEDALVLQQELIIQYNIIIRKNYSGPQSFMISTHKSRLIQIFINLIKNAIESMVEKGREDKILTIDINTTRTSDYMVKISDTGIGIAKENLTTVFEYGFTTKKKGYGFGLHSCANYMTEMGGMMIVESEGKNKGASFILLFSDEEKK